MYLFRKWDRNPTVASQVHIQRPDGLWITWGKIYPDRLAVGDSEVPADHPDREVVIKSIEDFASSGEHELAITEGAVFDAVTRLYRREFTSVVRPGYESPTARAIREASELHWSMLAELDRM